jgi:2-iminobutanoate/2-iminopropanoate deaminase
VQVEEIQTDKVGKPLGVYSQARRVPAGAELIYVSGMTSRNDAGEVVGVGDIEAQTEQALLNVSSVLEAAGSSLADVVKVTVFIRDMSHFDRIHVVRSRFFEAPYPASTMVQIASLADERSLIEIEAVAAVAPA